MDQEAWDQARKLDQENPLRHFRSQFVISDPDQIYLDGNSLGRLPGASQVYLGKMIKQQWGQELIKSWNKDWIHKSERIGAKLADLLGARPDEIIMADATSVNLYKLAYGALAFQSSRKKIISDQLNFPSDLYILQGLIRHFGHKHQLQLVGSADGISIETSELAEALDQDTALVCLSEVVFKSAFRYDMAEINHLAHQQGSLTLWDLSHSAGAVPIHLNKSEVDLAVGCTYKYLNGGPGAPAFLFVRKDLQDELESPVQGWFGTHDPFAFDLQYKPASGIRKWLSGTPPVLSLAAIEPGLDVILSAGMEQIYLTGVKQSEYLIGLFKRYLYPLGFQLGSPEQPEKRGSHISIKHQDGYRICQALLDPSVGNQEVIPDFRQPDHIRLAITPLYTTFEEIFLAIDQIKYICRDQLYLNYPAKVAGVT
ncbi:MAG: kynureninase [Candidatus Cyclobacteriaceae bacterium M3_2C_046]